MSGIPESIISNAENLLKVGALDKVEFDRICSEMGRLIQEENQISEKSSVGSEASSIPADKKGSNPSA